MINDLSSLTTDRFSMIDQRSLTSGFAFRFGFWLYCRQVSGSSSCVPQARWLAGSQLCRAVELRRARPCACARRVGGSHPNKILISIPFLIFLRMSGKFLKDPNRRPPRARHRIRVQREFSSSREDAPRRPQDAHKTLQDTHKRPQDAHKTPQDGPRGLQDHPKTAQDTSKTVQDGPKRLQDAMLGVFGANMQPS